MVPPLLDPPSVQAELRRLFDLLADLDEVVHPVGTWLAAPG